MDGFLDTTYLYEFWQATCEWIEVYALNLANALQLLVAIFALFLALVLVPFLRLGTARIAYSHNANVWLTKASSTISMLALPLTWLGLQWISRLVAVQSGFPHYILTITVSLLAAWIIIRLASSLIREPPIAKAVSILTWIIAALNILGLLDPTIILLDQLALDVGKLHISLLTVIKGVIALGVLVWAAMLLTRVTEQRISSLKNLTPSVQVLLTKLIKIVLVTLAVVIAISSVGIDLTAFAVFSGAVGVGLGLGLQKSVANLISGVLILLDKSVKPGDVIEVSNTFGQVKSLGGRYASVITRDGIEHLIPNEELISQRVTNWSYSSNQVRLRLSVGISYKSNVRKAMELMHAAANKVNRIKNNPPTAVLFKNLGDSSVDLELRFWIDDPMNGISNLKSEVLLNIWDKFHKHGIEFPYPQRDLHIKTDLPLQSDE